VEVTGDEEDIVVEWEIECVWEVDIDIEFRDECVWEWVSVIVPERVQEWMDVRELEADVDLVTDNVVEWEGVNDKHVVTDSDEVAEIDCVEVIETVKEWVNNEESVNDKDENETDGVKDVDDFWDPDRDGVIVLVELIVERKEIDVLCVRLVVNDDELEPVAVLEELTLSEASNVWLKVMDLVEEKVCE
jgi:hypothetical protein